MNTDKQVIEIFHLLFSQHLESKIDKALYALKGGCNLRFFFKSIRYSEDIDFDARTIAKETLRQKVNKLLTSTPFLQSLKLKGIEIQQKSEPKQTETTQRWKLSLKATGLSLPIPTKIEFSRRQMNENCLYESVDPELIRAYNLYPILLNHYSIQAAFTQKIDALLNRNETQARDVFDLKLLLNCGAKIENIPHHLREKAFIGIENLMTISFQEFKSQVVAYLMDDYQNFYDTSDKWQVLQEDIMRMLEQIAL
jgi:predicted nucleotidyltransferase component of viral defense system